MRGDLDNTEDVSTGRKTTQFRKKRQHLVKLRQFRFQRVVVVVFFGPTVVIIVIAGDHLMQPRKNFLRASFQLKLCSRA